jgi:hypothetical protein
VIANFQGACDYVRGNTLKDIDYILTVTEQGIAKTIDSAGPQAVVQMIRMCLQELSASE